MAQVAAIVILLFISVFVAFLIALGAAVRNRAVRAERRMRDAHVLLSPALVDAHLRDQAPPWSLRGGDLMITEQGRLTLERIGPGIQRLGWLAETLGYRG